MTNISNAHVISILGCGAFGLALSKLVASSNNKVRLWSRNQGICDYINKYKHHPSILSNLTLDHNVIATSHLNQAMTDANIVFLAIPMAALAEVASKIKPLMHQDIILVATTKGIDAKHLWLSCDVINMIYKRSSAKTLFLSGPSFAEELAKLKPTGMVLAGSNHQAYDLVKNSFSDHIKLFYSEDIIGVCLGGALKNVLAIACGVCLGLALGKNALASLITLGLREITSLAQAMGAKIDTLYHLSGIGDMILSCSDSQSRNFRLGMMLAQKQSLPDCLKQIKSSVEGVNTAKAIPLLQQKFNIDMPILMAVYQLLYKKLAPDLIIKCLYK